MSAYHMPAEAQMGSVHLAVRDLDRALRFYHDLLGLDAVQEDRETVALRAGEKTLVKLTGRPGAAPRAPRAPGLYHFAILTPSRRDLGQTLRGLLDAGYPLQGASDHGVSEALYLADPEGNGIEIYVDRPRSVWPRQGDALRMVTEPMDVEGVLAAGNGGSGRWSGLPAGTRIGHVHLQVSDISAAESFYTRALGLDLMQRYGPSAAFFSAGGYHHHIGANTWASAGAPPAHPNAAGMINFALILPTAEALMELAAHLRATGVAVETQSDGLFVRDPSGNAVALDAP